MYRTYKSQIKKGHRLFDYFTNISLNANNLYNVTNYYYRQIISGYESNFKEDNQIDVLNDINEYLINKNKPLFTKEDKSFVNYYLLDGVFKYFKNKDYYALPAQVNQQTMKEVHEAYTGFYSASKKYYADKTNFTGKPKLPKYTKKGSLKTVTFTNQVCGFKENKYLKFPKAKTLLNIGKLANIKSSTLKEVRVIPHHGIFTVEVVLDIPSPEKETKKPNNIIGLDIGVDNFVTTTNNAGLQPFIINGKIIKSINQYFNKQNAYYKAILMNGKDPKGQNFVSNRLNKLFLKRKNQMDDFIHKASTYLVNYCVKNNIDTVVIGSNKNKKQSIIMRKKDTQNFVNIPYDSFIRKLQYKLEAEGINFFVTEESYTSKASFLDNDEMPVYKENDNKAYSFSGKRIKRGLYKSKDGTLINADCNGSANIIKKVIPDAFKGKGNSGVVDTPIVVNVLKD